MMYWPPAGFGGSNIVHDQALPAIAGASRDLSCEVLTTPGAIERVRGQWDALWHGTSAPRQSQSCDWVLASWRARAAGHKLWVLVIRCDGRVALIWPMTLRRRGWCRIAETMRSPGGDYDALLVEDGPHGTELLCAAWAYLRKRLPADLLNVPLATVDSPREVMLRGQGLTRYVEHLPCAQIDHAMLADWPAYWATRSKKLRHNMSRLRRRLEETGDCAVRWLEDPAEIERAIDAMLEWKARWARERGLNADVFGTQAFRGFLLDMVERPVRCGRLRLMALMIDNQPVAVSLAAIDKTRLEGLITTYDPAYATFSPGSLLLTETLQWCGKHGLSCDMRHGDESYKDKWASTTSLVANYDIALTHGGALHLTLRVGLFRLRALRETLRAALPDSLRHRLRALRRRLGKPPARPAAAVAPAA